MRDALFFQASIIMNYDVGVNHHEDILFVRIVLYMEHTDNLQSI